MDTNYRLYPFNNDYCLVTCYNGGHILCLKTGYSVSPREAYPEEENKIKEIFTELKRLCELEYNNKPCTNTGVLFNGVVYQDQDELKKAIDLKETENFKHLPDSNTTRFTPMSDYDCFKWHLEQDEKGSDLHTNKIQFIYYFTGIEKNKKPSGLPQNYIQRLKLIHKHFWWCKYKAPEKLSEYKIDCPILRNIYKMPVNGNRLELPDNETFDNYQQVKNTLILAGGKYSKNGFTFKTEAKEIKERLLNGETINDKKKFQFFATPNEQARIVIELADIKEDHTVLEPSAGHGALIDAIQGSTSGLTIVELMPENIEVLKTKGYDPLEIDFLELDCNAVSFDRIIANPPFTKGQDIEHIKHMYKCLNNNGRLVSIASIGWQTGNNKKQIAFREWLKDLKADIIPIEAGAFKESGTNIETCIIVINK